MARLFSVLALLSALLWLWAAYWTIIGYTGYQRFLSGITGEGPSLSLAFGYVRESQSRLFGLWLPTWLALLVPAILPILWLLLTASAVWRRGRYGQGRCSTCGYDLRASPSRCPECGTEVDTGADQVSTQHSAKAAERRVLLVLGSIAVCLGLLIGFVVAILLGLEAEVGVQVETVDGDEKPFMEEVNNE